MHSEIQNTFIDEWIEKSISKRLMGVVSVVIALMWIILPDSYGQDEENSGALRIITRTDLNSAQYNIDNPSGPGANPTDQEKKKDEDDRAREVIGIGEGITLTLNGKPKGETKELKWSFKKGGQYMREMKDTEGKVSIQLTAKDDITAGGSVTVEVCTSDERKVTAQFEVLIPTGFEAEHAYKGPPRVIGVGTDAGAGTILDITVLPTTVNFSKIRIIERDGGSIPGGCSLDMGHKGNGCDKAIKIEDKNNFQDTIARSLPLDSFKSTPEHPQPPHILNPPQKWAWICRFMTHTGDGGPGSEAHDRCHVKTLNQESSFEYAKDAQGNNVGVSATLTKFGKTATRNSVDGILHLK